MSSQMSFQKLKDFKNYTQPTRLRPLVIVLAVLWPNLLPCSWFKPVFTPLWSTLVNPELVTTSMQLSLTQNWLSIESCITETWFHTTLLWNGPSISTTHSTKSLKIQITTLGSATTPVRILHAQINLIRSSWASPITYSILADAWESFALTAATGPTVQLKLWPITTLSSSDCFKNLLYILR